MSAPAGLAPEVWRKGLDTLVDCPVWPVLLAWFDDEQIRRILAAEAPEGAAVQAAYMRKGARALMLAIENERENLKGLDHGWRIGQSLERQQRPTRAAAAKQRGGGRGARHAPDLLDTSGGGADATGKDQGQ